MTEFQKRLITASILAVLTIFILFYVPFIVFFILISVLILYILNYELPRLASPNKLSYWLLALVYIFVPCSLILYFQASQLSYLNFLALIWVAAHDTGSYIAGKLWGSRKILPKISPGKTWEGFIGGYFCTLAISLLLFRQNISTKFLLIITPFVLLISLCALAGDLFESYLKRKAKIKDSGSILPGHGGILDRIDSLLFVIVLLFLLKNNILVYFIQ